MVGDNMTKKQKKAEKKVEKPQVDTEADIKVLREERDDLMTRLQRVSADYMNYQKRIQKDIQQARDFANEQLMKELLGVLDDMERALAAARENHSEDDPLLTGMRLVHDKAIDTLGRFGLAAIEAAGKQFDPEMHSALLEQESEDHPPKTVVQEVQRGYQLKGRTIRPASVIVSKLPEGQDAASLQKSNDQQQPAEGSQDPAANQNTSGED